MIGVVLAAGAGVRMRPLSQDRPKALIPTLDLPQLGWVLGRLHTAGITRAWVNAHFGHDGIRAQAEAAGRQLGIRVQVSHEREVPLGTAGALRKVSKHLTELFVVMSADVVSDFPIERLVEAHRSSGATASLLALPSEDQADFALDEGWVGELVDRRDQVRPGHVYGNIGVFEPEVLAYIPAGPSGLYETVFRGLVGASKGIAALEWNGYWLNAGTPTAHLKANLDALSASFDDGGIPNLLGRAPIRHDALGYAGAGARVEEVELRHAVVGQRARVEPGTHLERCVVWDGATVPRGNHRDSVFTGRRMMKVG